MVAAFLIGAAITTSKLAIAGNVLSAIVPVVLAVGNYIEKNRENTK